ncbi:MAG: 50S ribosomal protein L32 [Bacteroidaceae bacterium]|nr:50S ribosomal protein L32 [Bacteroidaceae bacterium]
MGQTGRRQHIQLQTPQRVSCQSSGQYTPKHRTSRTEGAWYDIPLYLLFIHKGDRVHVFHLHSGRL